MAAFTTPHELLSSRLARFTRVLHGVEDGSVTAIHRTRVASRRLREVLPVLQLDRETASKLNRRLKKITRRLGPARELDVVLLLIADLRASGRHSPRALNLVKAEVAKERRRLASSMRAKGIDADLRRAARKLATLAARLSASETPADGGKPGAKPDADGDGLEAHGEETDRVDAAAEAVQTAIETRIGRRAQALKRAIADAGQVYIAERLHAVRIAMKKLRYVVELAVETAGERDSSELKILKRGQELLGRLHDLQVLLDRVRQVQSTLSPPDLTVWRELDALVIALDQSCRRLHARYMGERHAFVSLCDKFNGKTAGGRGVAARRIG